MRAASDAKVRRMRGGGGSANRAAAGALRIGNALGAALSPRRLHRPAERSLLLPAAVLLLAVATVAVLWPQVIAWPLAALTFWLGAVLLLRAARSPGARSSS